MLHDTRNGGALHYFGAVHSRDASHEQFERLRQAWQELRPTVAFYEGPDRGIGSDDRDTIEQLGESGYVRYLATRDGVRLARLEPGPGEEIAYLLERFTPEQVKLFFVLREAQRLRERERLSAEEIGARISELLERARPLEGIGLVITTTDELGRTYRKYWSSPAEWWEAPTEWFDPLLPSQKTGGIFTNDVNRASSEFRNVNMFRVLASAVLSGERVFAVVGRNHVPMQAAALRCALED
ncbi:MAG: hypothetical protein KY466_11765 [Gemmatimonadetes bacterium]|nr:hypothetical protein [Gemmatimonadota bacterium]